MRRQFSGGACSILSNEEQDLFDSVSDWSNNVLLPKVSEMDTKGEMDPQILKQLFEMGYMGIETESELSFMSSVLVIEALARVDPAVSVVVDVQNTLINRLFLNYGTEAQIQRWIPPLATEHLGSFCLSEPESGSDAFALKTRAVRDGDDFVLNGRKMWITNAQEAGVFLVFANANPEQGYRGITCFIVPRDAPGLIIGKKEDKIGIRASSTCEVILENCRVPQADILGEIGKGYKMAISVLNEGRIGIGAQMLGLAQASFDHTVAYVKDRVQFKRPVFSNQGVQFELADMFKELHAARLLVYNAARLKEMGNVDFALDAAVAKLKASEVATKCSQMAITLHGGVGITKDFPVEKLYRDSTVGQIYEGASGLMKATIAKFL